MSALTPKDCNAELSNEEAPPLSRKSLPLTPVSASTSTPSTPPKTTTLKTTTPTKTSPVNTNIIIREHLVEPKDDFILYDSDGEDFSLFTDGNSDYCGPMGAESTGYPGEYKFFPEYGQIQVGKPNNEKS